MRRNHTIIDENGNPETTSKSIIRATALAASLTPIIPNKLLGQMLDQLLTMMSHTSSLTKMESLQLVKLMSATMRVLISITTILTVPLEVAQAPIST